MWAEKPKPVVITKTVEKHHHHHHDHYHDYDYWWPYRPRPWRPCVYPMWYSTTMGSSKCEDAVGYNTTDGVFSSSDVNLNASASTTSAQNSAGVFGTIGPKGVVGVQARSVPTATINYCAVEAPKFDLGTGWGETVEDQVNMVSFERGVQVAEVELFYATAKVLKAAGVNLSKQAAVAVDEAWPKAFGFCKPPSK